jgi:hypothetical protein
VPTRLLVEPLALQLVRRYEASKEHICRINVSMLSMNPLAGSDYILPLRLLVVVHLVCVHLGTRFNSNFIECISCMSFVVP